MNEKLIEQRNELIAKMEAILKVAETETRAFTSEELEKVEGYKQEIANIDATIKMNEEARSFTRKPAENKAPEVRSLAKEIRELNADANKEIEVGERELRDKSHVISTTAVGSSNAQMGNIAKTTYANYILDKLAYVSPLYGAVRHERFGNSKHQIPVQANKLGKFVPMKELADYAKQTADFAPIMLEAHKFGTLISFSEEVLEDTGYNVEAELLRQLAEAYGTTIDELLVKGESSTGVEGLNSFKSVATEVEVVQEAPTAEHITAMYFALPIKYRQNATWVISDKVAKALTDLKDVDGRPLLVQSYNGSPFGAGSTLLGRPVIINEHVDQIFFGDLQRALIVGERKSLSLQKSTEYGFIRDEIAIKANMRLDIKKGLKEAIVVSKASDLKAKTK